MSIVLHQFPPAYGLPISESPPAAKIELYCRLTGVAFEAVVGDVRRSPNRLVPFVEWSDGSLQAESGDIVARLESMHRLDDGLDGAALAKAKAVADQVEAICYDACLYDRFTDPRGWVHQRPVTHALMRHWMPGWAATLLLPLVRHKQTRRARRGGLDVPEKGHAASVAAIRAVEAVLERQSYLAGERPSTADCAVWPNLLHVGATPVSSPPREAVRGSRAVVAWIERVAADAGLTLTPTWRT